MKTDRLGSYRESERRRDRGSDRQAEDRLRADIELTDGGEGRQKDRKERK